MKPDFSSEEHPRAALIIAPDNPSIHSVAQLRQIIHQSRTEPLGIKDGLFITDQLVRHGYCDDALRLIDDLVEAGHSNETFHKRLAMLSKAAEQIRAIHGVSTTLADSIKMETLLSFQSTLVETTGNSGRLAIVYATAWNNFDISFPLLHCLIEGHADQVLYVKNPNHGMYANGNNEFGGSIDKMSSNICKLIDDINPSKLTVMGFSGGGYAALHLAAKAGADTYLGLGIKTDFSRDSVMKKTPMRTAPNESDYASNTLINMRELPEIKRIRRAVLYYGDRNQPDQEHAVNMKRLKNFTIRAVPNGPHNLVMVFLAKGILQEVICNALD